MTANGILFGLAYVRFDGSKEYYYLRIIVKVSTQEIPLTSWDGKSAIYMSAGEPSSCNVPYLTAVSNASQF